MYFSLSYCVLNVVRAIVSRCCYVFLFWFGFWATFTFVFELSGCYFCFKFTSLFLFLFLLLILTSFEVLLFKFVFALGLIRMVLHRLIGPCYFLMDLYKLSLYRPLIFCLGLFSFSTNIDFFIFKQLRPGFSSFTHSSGSDKLLLLRL